MWNMYIIIRTWAKLEYVTNGGWKTGKQSVHVASVREASIILGAGEILGRQSLHHKAYNYYAKEELISNLVEWVNFLFSWGEVEQTIMPAGSIPSGSFFRLKIILAPPHSAAKLAKSRAYSNLFQVVKAVLCGDSGKFDVNFSAPFVAERRPYDVWSFCRWTAFLVINNYLYYCSSRFQCLRAVDRVSHASNWYMNIKLLRGYWCVEKLFLFFFYFSFSTDFTFSLTNRQAYWMKLKCDDLLI